MPNLTSELIGNILDGAAMVLFGAGLLIIVGICGLMYASVRR